MRCAAPLAPDNGKDRSRVNRMYRRSVLVFGVVAIGLGCAILGETAAKGGGIGVGYLFGALFIALGSGRLYLLHKR